MLEAGVRGGGTITETNIDEIVDVNHVGRHVVGPLENLRADVDEKCVG